MTDPEQPLEPADRELRGWLRSLAQGPADDGFSARLHQRLVQQGPPAAQGWSGRVRFWFQTRPVLTGSLAGASAGVSAFALLMALSQSAHPPALAPHAALPSPAQPLPAACEPSASAQAKVDVFVVPEGKVALVQLHFAVDRSVDAAEFSVLLPEGLAFFSDGAALPERAFRWSAPLDHGDNRIPIAVVGTRPGRHHLTATATIAGEVVVREVVLDVREPA